MFFINKITESYYNDYYKQIFRNVLENVSENEKICIINLNYFNIFEHFSHFIKKFNVYFTIFFKNKDYQKKFLNQIDGEELQDHIECDFDSIKDLIKLPSSTNFSKIILFDIQSESKLNQMLHNLYSYINKQSMIYIYISLTDNSSSQIQTNIRQIINHHSSYELSNILNYNDFFNNLHQNNYFTVDKIRVFRDNYYMIYGKNNIYEIILIPK